MFKTIQLAELLYISEPQGLCMISFILADHVQQECMNLKFSDTINSVAIQDLKLSIWS